MFHALRMKVLRHGWRNRVQATTIGAATIQMKCIPPKPRRAHLFALGMLMAAASVLCQERKPATLVSSPLESNVAQFVSQLRGKAKALESSSGMRVGFQSFTSAHKLAPPERPLFGLCPGALAV
jgi:hypothetical protein